MKHVKILITLTATVVLFTLAVFGVEKLTTPVIDAELLRIANEAKFDVLPTLDEEADKEAIQLYYAAECSEDAEDCNDTEYDLSGLEYVTKIFVIPEKGYIYEVTYRGFQSDISYLIALDLEGNVTGMNIVSQNETAGLGDQILNTEFLESFRGLSSDAAENGDIELDGLAGATPWVTLGGLKNSLNEVMVFHKVEFGGAVVETEEQKLARYYEEITAQGATFTDVSADNSLPEYITKMEVANDGTVDIAAIYTVEFTTDYTADGTVNEYLVSVSLSDGSLLGMRVLQANDSAGIGSELIKDAFNEPFTGMSQDDALTGNFDEQAGASYTITLNAFKGSLEDTINFHKSIYDGVVILTPEEKLALWIEGLEGVFGTFEDVTSEYTLEQGVTKVEVLEFGGSDLMALYTVEFNGYNIAEATTYKIAMAVESGAIIDVYMVDVNETDGIGSDIDSEEFLAQFAGMTQVDAENGEYDSQAGASYPLTLGAFKESVTNVVHFHMENFQGVIFETYEEMLLRYKEELSEASATFTDESADFDLSTTMVTAVETTDESVVFTVVFQGYYDNKDTAYFIGFDKETGNINGIRVYEAGDSTGIGKLIIEDVFNEQFAGITQDDALAGGFDEQAGASYPITLAKFEESLVDAVNFYKVEFGGETVETPEEKLARWYEEISAVDASFTDVTGTYTLTGGITKIELANNGSEDFAVIFTAEFEGYVDVPTIYMVSFDLTTGDVLGLRVLEAGDTVGIGSLIGDDEFFVQFAGMVQADALNGNFDEQAGASYPITLGEFAVSLEGLVNFYIAEFTEEEVETYEEMVARYYEELTAEGAVITDDTANHTLSSGVTKVELANNGSEDFAVIFTVEFTTAYTSAGEVNEYIISFDLSTGDIIGVRFLQANDTAGIGAEIMNEDFYTQFTSISKTTATAGGFDEQAGASYPQTLLAFESSIDDVVDYYVVEYETPERPAPVVTPDNLLLEAYPTAASFVEVYESYAYQEGIGNIYAAYDGGGALLGVVYVGVFTGNSGDVYFGWGIELDTGTTQQLSIYIENETWDQNTDNYDDATWGTDFKTTPYLDQYEGINMTSIMFSPIDDIAGVSTTTGGLNATLETIVEYHLTEIIGGAN